jgi:hypothetical protein
MPALHIFSEQNQMPRLSRHPGLAIWPIIRFNTDDGNNSHGPTRGYVMERTRKRAVISLSKKSLTKLGSAVGVLFGRTNPIEPRKFTVAVIDANDRN